jgi:hypothetical protein
LLSETARERFIGEKENNCKNEISYNNEVNDQLSGTYRFQRLPKKDKSKSLKQNGKKNNTSSNTCAGR